MGAETIVYGYIRLEPRQREYNKGVLAHWRFDELYPFPDIYSPINSGYGGDIISFAGSMKSLDEDWDDWEEKFESLLFQLFGRSAHAHLQHETDGTIKTVEYLCEDGWDLKKQLQDRSWTKWYYHTDGQASSGVPVIRRL